MRITQNKTKVAARQAPQHRLPVGSRAHIHSLFLCLLAAKRDDTRTRIEHYCETKRTTLAHVADWCQNSSTLKQRKTEKIRERGLRRPREARKRRQIHTN